MKGGCGLSLLVCLGRSDAKLIYCKTANLFQTIVYLSLISTFILNVLHSFLIVLKKKGTILKIKATEKVKVVRPGID